MHVAKVIAAGRRSEAHVEGADTNDQRTSA